MSSGTTRWTKTPEGVVISSGAEDEELAAAGARDAAGVPEGEIEEDICREAVGMDFGAGLGAGGSPVVPLLAPVDRPWGTLPVSGGGFEAAGNGICAVVVGVSLISLTMSWSPRFKPSEETGSSDTRVMVFGAGKPVFTTKKVNLEVKLRYRA